MVTKRKPLKHRKAVSTIISYLIVLGVVAATLLLPYIPPIYKSVLNIMNSTSRQYNSSDTVAFDEAGNVIY